MSGSHDVGVGAAVGTAVGTAVGADVGADVGVTVGAAVGVGKIFCSRARHSADVPAVDSPFAVRIVLTSPTFSPPLEAEAPPAAATILSISNPAASNSNTVGAAVGTAVGAALGAAVGVAVGVAVGTAVGA